MVGRIYDSVATHLRISSRTLDSHIVVIILCIDSRPAGRTTRSENGSWIGKGVTMSWLRIWISDVVVAVVRAGGFIAEETVIEGIGIIMRDRIELISCDVIEGAITGFEVGGVLKEWHVGKRCAQGLLAMLIDKELRRKSPDTRLVFVGSKADKISGKQPQKVADE